MFIVRKFEDTEKLKKRKKKVSPQPHQPLLASHITLDLPPPPHLRIVKCILFGIRF